MVAGTAEFQNISMQSIMETLLLEIVDGGRFSKLMKNNPCTRHHKKTRIQRTISLVILLDIDGDVPFFDHSG